MEGFLENVSALFRPGDSLPWTDASTIQKCEREATGTVQGLKDQKESVMRLAWALVHSRHTPDVHRGIAMLEAQFSMKNSPPEQREVLYLMAVGYYRSGEYSRARKLVSQALEISPDFRQGSVLQKMINEKIKTDGVIGIGLAAGATALVAGGIALLASGRRH